MKVIDIKSVIESLPAERSAWRRGFIIDITFDEKYWNQG